MQVYAEIPVAFWACCYILLARAAGSRDTHIVEHLEPKTFWKAASNVAYKVAPDGMDTEATVLHATIALDTTLTKCVFINTQSKLLHRFEVMAESSPAFNTAAIANTCCFCLCKDTE